MLPKPRSVEVQIGHHVRGGHGRFDAWLAVMASQKSQQGRADRLADVLASLKGTTFGVVADPDESEDES